MTAYPYDIKLTIGDTEYGFMLTSPAGESKSIAIDEVEAPNSQYQLNRLDTEDTQLNTDFDVRQDQVLAQSSLAGGLGALEYDPEGDRYWWGTVVTHVPGKVYLPPPVNSKAFPSGAAAWAGSTTFLAADGTRYDFAWQGTRLYRRDASNSTNDWVLVYTAGAAITDVEIVDGAAYIAVPSLSGSTDFLYQSNPAAAATWTPTARDHAVFSVALGKPKFFKQLRGTTYAVVDNRKVFFSTDPTTDGWAGPIDTNLNGNFSGPPGDTSHAFTNMIAANDYLFVFKRDAAYNIDSQQEVTEVIWQFKDRPSVTQFQHIAVGGETLFYSISPEVYAYDPNTGRNLPLGLSRQSGFSCEEVLGLGADNQYVYVLAKVRVPTLRSASSAALLRCWRTSASTWAFECLWEDTESTAYYGLYVSPQGAGTRVYWFESDGTDSLHMDVPANWDETTSDSFATSGVWYTSIWRTGFLNFIKRWLWVATKTQGLGVSDTISIAYSTDDGASFTSLATLTASGLTFTNIPSVNSESIVLRFTYASAGTVTPVLRVYDLHGRVRWRYLPMVLAAVRVADYVELNNGTRANETAVTLRSNLETLRTSNATILYEDYLGNSFNVSVDKVMFKATRHETPERNNNGIYELEAILHLARADSGS